MTDLGGQAKAGVWRRRPADGQPDDHHFRHPGGPPQGRAGGHREHGGERPGEAGDRQQAGGKQPLPPDRIERNLGRGV